MRPVPKDRPFYAVDAYGEVQHVRWIGHVGGPFGEYVEVIDSDGECFPVSDISAWHDDADALERVIAGIFETAPAVRALINGKTAFEFGREMHRALLSGDWPPTRDPLALAVGELAATVALAGAGFPARRPRPFARPNPRLERATDGR